MCSLSTTVNNHSTEETDVVQHNEETFEDRIVIFFPPFLPCSDLHITFHLAVWWAETMERFV